MLRRPCFTLAGLSLAAQLAAGPSLTVYNGDLAVVRETRRVDLKAGRQRFSISGLPSRLDPGSVRLEGRGLRVLQQDFDADLGSPDRVLEACLGQPLKAVGKGGQAYEGRLLSYQDGQLLLQGPAGRLRILNRAEMASLDLPEPTGLLTRPTLSWDLEAAQAGPQDLGLSYLTSGLSWHADYVAVLDKTGATLGLDGWVSVDNQSGAAYKDAQVELMAGDIHRAVPRPLLMRAALASPAALAPAPAVAERSFADGHLYSLPDPVTLRQAQQMQVQLFNAAAVPVVKAYAYDGEQGGKAVQVTLEIKDDKASGLGRPLPAGTWRVFQADGSALELVGEDQGGPVARDETLTLALGDAFDVVGQRTVLREQPDAQGRVIRRSVKVELRNRGDHALTVLAREHAFGHWDLGASDQAWKRVDASTFSAELSLKAGEVKDWDYTIKMDY